MKENSLVLANRNGLITQWIAFSDVKKSTQKTYDKAVKHFFRFLQNNGIQNPARDDIIAYRDWLLNNVKASTAALYLTSVKLFFRFLAAHNLYINIADHIKGVKVENAHKKDALTIEQSRKVLSVLKDDTVKAKRDKAITALMLTCGLRSIEVIRANVGDIVSSYGKTFLKVQGKGRDGKYETVLIPQRVNDLITSYLASRGVYGDYTPLFVSTSNRNAQSRLQTQTISRMIKSKLKEAGFDSPRLTCHSLRHTAATTMLLAGVDIADVQMILRHSNVNTTQIYRHDLDRLKNEGENIAAAVFFDSAQC